MAGTRGTEFAGTVGLLLLVVVVVVLRLASGGDVMAADTPYTLRLGGLFPLFRTSTSNYDLDTAGKVRLGGFVMAVREINNKTDGVFDDLLPNTTIEFAVRDSKRDNTYSLFAAIDLIQNVFDGDGVHAVVGPANSGTSTLVAGILGTYELPQISYSATSPDLSLGSKYPYFLRTVPADTLQTQAMVDLCKYYNWKRVATVSTITDYSQAGLETFRDYADTAGIDIAESVVFASTATDTSVQAKKIVDSGSRIVIMYMHVVDGHTWLNDAFLEGFFDTPGYQIIASDPLLVPETYMQLRETHGRSDDEIETIMSGMMGFIQSSGRGTDVFNDFYDRMISQPDTMINDTYCSNATDDDGRFHLWHQDHDQNSSTPQECNGNQYSTFSTDPEDVETYTPYAYDAVMAVAHAWHDLVEVGGNYPPDADDLLANMLAVNFTGVTGRVVFDQGTGADEIGLGDRSTGVKARMRNYHRDLLAASTAFVTVGSWAAETGLEICDDSTGDDDGDDNGDDGGDCSSVQFSTTDNSVPSDGLPTDVTRLTSTLSGILYTLGALNMFCSLCTAGVLYQKRETKLVMLSQRLLMNIILLGVFMGSIGVLTGGLSASDHACAAMPWFQNLAFALILAPMALKQYRVHRIVNNRSLQHVKLPDSLMLRAVFGVVLCTALYLTLWMLADRSTFPHRAVRKELDGTSGYKKEIYCTAGNVVAVHLMRTIWCMFLLLLGRFSWLTREVAEAFNDSRYMASTVFTMLLIWLLTTAVSGALSSASGSSSGTRIYKNFIESFGFALSILAILIIYFLPKLLALWQGHEVEENFAIRRGGSRQPGSQSTGAGVVRSADVFADQGSGSSLDSGGNAPQSRQPRGPAIHLAIGPHNMHCFVERSASAHEASAFLTECINLLERKQEIVKRRHHHRTGIRGLLARAQSITSNALGLEDDEESSLTSAAVEMNETNSSTNTYSGEGASGARGAASQYTRVESKNPVIVSGGGGGGGGGGCRTPTVSPDDIGNSAL